MFGEGTVFGLSEHFSKKNRQCTITCESPEGELWSYKKQVSANSAALILIDLGFDSEDTPKPQDSQANQEGDRHPASVLPEAGEEDNGEDQEDEELPLSPAGCWCLLLSLTVQPKHPPHTYQRLRRGSPT